MRRQTHGQDRGESDWLGEMQAIYDDLARLRMERQCLARTQCCRFQLTGRVPHLTRGESLYLWKGIRASGRRSIAPAGDGRCPLLGKEGRCMVYAHRPFGCRTHFCDLAGGNYARELVAPLIHRLERLDAKLGGNGSRQITAVLQENC